MALPIWGVLLDVLLVAVIFAVASLAAAWALLRGLSSQFVVLAGTLGAVLFVAGYFFVAQSGDVNFFTQEQNDFEAVWSAQTPVLLKSGVAPETLDLVKNFALKYFLLSFPAWLAVGCLIAGFLSYYLASSILRRITLKVDRPLAFRYWVLPEFFVFGFIAACYLKFFMPENSVWDLLGDNLLVFFVGFYTLGGLSIVSFYFHKWGLSLFWRVVIYFLMVQFCLQIIVVLASFGIMDVWMDLRKLKAISTGEKNS